MTEIFTKFIVIDVGGEATLSFSVSAGPNKQQFEMVEAILASNPVIRFVESVTIGHVWDGVRYVPSESE